MYPLEFGGRVGARHSLRCNLLMAASDGGIVKTSGGITGAGAGGGLGLNAPGAGLF
jgi:hypothetical protein